jgi:hypothetical protein
LKHKLEYLQVIRFRDRGKREKDIGPSVAMFNLPVSN